MGPRLKKRSWLKTVPSVALCLSVIVPIALTAQAAPSDGMPAPPASAPLPDALPVTGQDYDRTEYFASPVDDREQARKKCETAGAQLGLAADKEEAHVRLCTYYLGGDGDAHSMLSLYRWNGTGAVDINCSYGIGGPIGWLFKSAAPLTNTPCFIAATVTSVSYAMADFIWVVSAAVMRFGSGQGLFNIGLVDGAYSAMVRVIFETYLLLLAIGVILIVLLWRIVWWRSDRNQANPMTVKQILAELGLAAVAITFLMISYEPESSDPTAPQSVEVRCKETEYAISVLSPPEDGEEGPAPAEPPACIEVVEVDLDAPLDNATPKSLTVPDIAASVNSWTSYAGNLIAHLSAQISASVTRSAGAESYEPSCVSYTAAMDRTAQMLRAAEHSKDASRPLQLRHDDGLVAVSNLWEAVFLPSWIEASYGETETSMVSGTWCHLLEARTGVPRDVRVEIGRAAGYPSLEMCGDALSSRQPDDPVRTGPRQIEYASADSATPSRAYVFACTQGTTNSTGGTEAFDPTNEISFLMKISEDPVDDDGWLKDRSWPPPGDFNPNTETYDAKDEERYINSSPWNWSWLFVKRGNADSYVADNFQPGQKWTRYGHEKDRGANLSADEDPKDESMEDAADRPVGLSYYGYTLCDDRQCRRDPYTVSDYPVGSREAAVSLLLFDACVWDGKYGSFRTQVAWSWVTDLHSSQCEVWWHTGRLPKIGTGSVYDMPSLYDRLNWEYLTKGNGWASATLYDEWVPYGSGDNPMSSDFKLPPGFSAEPPEGAEEEDPHSVCSDFGPQCNPRKSLRPTSIDQKEEYDSIMGSIHSAVPWRGHLNRSQAFISVEEAALRDDLPALGGGLTTIGALGSSGGGTTPGASGFWSTMFIGIFSLITAVVYGYVIIGMGMGLILAKAGALVLIMLSPFMLLAMALPFGATKTKGKKYFRVLLGFLVADLILSVALSVILLVITFTTVFLSLFADSSWILMLAPLISVFLVKYLWKKMDWGRSPFSLTGSMALAGTAAGAFHRSDAPLFARGGAKNAAGAMKAELNRDDAKIGMGVSSAKAGTKKFLSSTAGRAAGWQALQADADSGKVKKFVSNAWQGSMHSASDSLGRSSQKDREEADEHRKTWHKERVSDTNLLGGAWRTWESDPIKARRVSMRSRASDVLDKMHRKSSDDSEEAKKRKVLGRAYNSTKATALKAIYEKVAAGEAPDRAKAAHDRYIGNAKGILDNLPANESQAGSIYRYRMDRLERTAAKADRAADRRVALDPKSAAGMQELRDARKEALKNLMDAADKKMPAEALYRRSSERAAAAGRSGKAIDEALRSAAESTTAAANSAAAARIAVRTGNGGIASAHQGNMPSLSDARDALVERYGISPERAAVIAPLIGSLPTTADELSERASQGESASATRKLAIYDALYARAKEDAISAGVEDELADRRARIEAVLGLSYYTANPDAMDAETAAQIQTAIAAQDSGVPTEELRSLSESMRQDEYAAADRKFAEVADAEPLDGLRILSSAQPSYADTAQYVMDRFVVSADNPQWAAKQVIAVEAAMDAESWADIKSNLSLLMDSGMFPDMDADQQSAALESIGANLDSLKLRALRRSPGFLAVQDHIASVMGWADEAGRNRAADLAAAISMSADATSAHESVNRFVASQKLNEDDTEKLVSALDGVRALRHYRGPSLSPDHFRPGQTNPTTPPVEGA